MKKCIVISDSFKGSLSSSGICGIVRQTDCPGWTLAAIPVADGGEGTVDCFLDACGGRRVTVDVSGPLGQSVQAAYAMLPDGTAVVECASAAGLPQVADHPDPARATTYGVGQLMRHAAENGAARLILGLGGSCTNDGGCGAAAALGVRFLDGTGQSFVPTGATLRRIAHIELSGLNRSFAALPLTVMCDIDNPMYGPRGAAYVFAPQKGADPALVEQLDQGLHHLARVIRQELGQEVSALPGAGAAGGFGAGCVAFLGGQLRSGIDTVLDTVDFDRRLPGCDLVITGEGKLDLQSLGGKVISGVSARCRRAGVPVLALVGLVELTPGQLAAGGLTDAVSINPPGITLDEAMDHAADNYRTALAQVLSRYMDSKQP